MIGESLPLRDGSSGPNAAQAATSAEPARRHDDDRPTSTSSLVGATFEQIAGPTKPIAGVVRLKGTGKLLAGVHVLGAEPSTWTEVSAMTDAEGHFRLVGLPKGGSYQVRAAARPGIDPFLDASITVTDTEGLKPIETALELPRGVIVTGRMIDASTGRLVRAKHVSHHKVPANHSEGRAGLSHSGLVDPIFRITVPPGEGMLYANVRGTNLPYTRARLKPADKGKGIGGIGDGETLTMRLDAYHAYKMIDVPPDAESIAVDLELTRGDTRKGRLIGPTGKPVIGRECAGYSDAWADAKTLADDTFEVFALEAGHPREVVFAHKELQLVGWLIIKDEDLKTDAPMVVHLHRAGSIKGRLVDEDGLPVVDADFLCPDRVPRQPGPRDRPAEDLARKRDHHFGHQRPVPDRRPQTGIEVDHPGRQRTSRPPSGRRRGLPRDHGPARRDPGPRRREGQAVARLNRRRDRRVQRSPGRVSPE